MSTVEEHVKKITDAIKRQMDDAITEAVNAAVQSERQQWRDALIEIGAEHEWRQALILMNLVNWDMPKMNPAANPMREDDKSGILT